MNVIRREKWIDEGRQTVLDALDEFVRVSVGHVGARGWTDQELPDLFRSVDAQLDKIAERINLGIEPGSLFFRVETQEEIDHQTFDPADNGNQGS